MLYVWCSVMNALNLFLPLRIHLDSLIDVLCFIAIRYAVETAERRREHKFSGFSVRRVHRAQFTGLRSRRSTSRAPARRRVDDLGVRWRATWRADLPVDLLCNVSQSSLCHACDSVLRQQRLLPGRAQWRPGSSVSSRHRLLSACLPPVWPQLTTLPAQQHALLRLPLKQFLAGTWICCQK